MVDISVFHTRSSFLRDLDWLEASASPPASRLVGVELNPGPPKNAAKQQKKKKQSSPSHPSVSGGRSQSTAIGSAYGGSLRTRIRFGAGRQDGSMRVEFCVPLARIGNSGTTGNAGLLLSDSNYYTSSALSPVGLFNGSGRAAPVYWQSSAINSISQAFSRHQVKNLRFEYRPQSTTARDDELVFGFSSDPNNPLVSPALGATPESLLGLSENFPFAPWMAWSLPVRHDVVEKYNVGANSGVLSEDRWVLDGAFGCCGESSVTSPQVYGVLYLCGDYEMMDLNPYVALTGTDPGLRRRTPVIQAHACAASSACVKCGLQDDYIALDGDKITKIDEKALVGASSSSATQCVTGGGK